MTASPKQQQKQRRTQRLSAALRDNLKRRKAQARGRKAEGDMEHNAGGSPSETHDSAGFGDDKRTR